MKKLILFSIITLVLVYSASMQALTFISEPDACVSCHDLKHQGDPLVLGHSNKSINCIDCHSGEGIRGYVDARKALAFAILLEKARPFLNQNISYAHLSANCTKCHAQVRVMPEKNGIGFWKKMGTGGHRNKTCEDCHTTGFLIPRCTDCHKPHKEENWNNSVCLACHSDPHIPLLNGSYSETVAKDNCAACHKAAYDTLTFYNSRHNQLSSCTNCHPAHKEKKKCFDCHSAGHTSHPFAQNNCAACHGKATCKDCHKEPHAPFRGLPRIAAKEAFNDYAATRKGY